jgi:hypothetical protein
METWTNAAGIRVLQLHYSADPVKGGGAKTYVPDLKRWLSPWALNEYNRMTNKSMYAQEYEIDFEARLGTLMYQLTEAAALERSFPIPATWTRVTVVDPHPRVPHFWLWGATDPWGDRWVYRELWPSKVCFRYENDVLCGSATDVPEDDHRYTTRDFVETVKWLESAENNQGTQEKIARRLIDYAARGFKNDNDSEDQRSMQQRYEDWSRDPDINYPFSFIDAIKDKEAGVDAVNGWLQPRQVELPNGTIGDKSRLHIFWDKCPELVHQLKTNRFEQQTTQMAVKEDPTSKPVKKRNHGTDCLKYYCQDKHEYEPPVSNARQKSDWQPMHAGVGY